MGVFSVQIDRDEDKNVKKEYCGRRERKQAREHKKKCEFGGCAGKFGTLILED